MSTTLLIGTALIEAAGRLADVLARENAALAALDLARAASMLSEKQDAASLFARAWEQAQAGLEPSRAGTATRDLLPLARRLASAAAENRRLLERGIEVQGRVLALVARAVPRAPGGGPSPYGARGTASPPAVRAPLALSLRA